MNVILLPILKGADFMATQQEVIKSFMKTLDVHTIKKSNFSSDKQVTTNVLDFAIKACSFLDKEDTVAIT